ncbi:MAG: FAD-binding protein [Solirubrobacteraceae bacterium]|nr:FAD-binding protein [Solirubrobacteraceae bacterium]
MWRNWSGEQRCSPARVTEPADIDEIIAALGSARNEGRTVRPVGSGHSFTALVPTDGVLISLRRMDRVLEIDRERRRVRVQGGIPLHALNEALAGAGLALENLGDIDQQTIAGAIATGTHGTGSGYGNLPSLVEAITLVTGTGEVLRCSRDDDPDLWRAARVSLGALGVISEVELRCVDAFTLHGIDAPAPLAATIAALEARATEAEHFEFFCFPHTDRALTRTNRRVETAPAPPPAWKAWTTDVLLTNHVFGAACAVGRARPALIPHINRALTRAAGNTERTDRSDRIFASPRLVRFVEMEYALPRDALPDVFSRARAWIEETGFPVSFPMEVRVGAADDALLSPAHGRDSAYLAIHVFRGMPWEPYFRAVEAICDEHGGRPHWGKRHFQTAETLRARYPEWDRFAAVRDRCDPDRVMANAHLDRVLGP